MPSISFGQSAREWRLESGDALYVVAVDDDRRLRHRYFGVARDLAPLAPPHDWWWEPPATLELPVREPNAFGDTLLAAVFGPADRDLHLRYHAHAIEESALAIELRDEFHPLSVELRYELFGETGVVRRSIALRNDGTEAVTLESAGSLSVSLAGDRTLHHLAGRWSDEMHLVSEPLTPGRKVIESRRGFTSHSHQPWFALEGAGSVVYGALEWSGNWQLSFERDPQDTIVVTGGMHDFDFEHVLEPGNRLAVPPSILGVAEGSLDDASRALHRYLLAHVIPQRPSEDTLPVIFEGWYTSAGMNMTAERLVREAEAAADIGVELFIVTAGWYAEITTGGIEHSEAGGFITREGDWRPWPASFPNGLEEVADKVRSLGMRFGLWWEPETVAADSELFREHPDWVFQSGARGPQPTPHGQLLINLAHPDAYAYVKEDVFRLVRTYELDYFRTDMNQSWREIGDPTGRSGPGRDLAWRHLTNYYRLLDELRAAFPDLIIENCAGGGGRLDLGMLQRTHTSWLSDNINQLTRLGMFIDGTRFLPPILCEDWMIEWPGRPKLGFMNPEEPEPDIDFRFRVAMLGHLGIGADLFQWDDEWSQRARHHIARYKQVRRTTQLGELYHLTPTPPRDGTGDWAAVAMVAEDRQEAVAYCFRLASERDTFRLVVPGLDRAATYEVAFDGQAEPQRLDGATLSGEGVDVVVPNRLSSELVMIRRAS